MAQRLTAGEMSSITGVAQRTINRWARSEQWPVCRELIGGLVIRKYEVSLMPSERQAALTGETPAANSPGGQLTIIDDELPALTSLKGWQREVMDARVALFREFQRLERKYGTGLAIQEFTSQAKNKTLPGHLQKLVKVANARGGANGRAISKSMIYRWKGWSKTGLAAFAPKGIEKKEIPPWATFFFKCYQMPSNPSIPEAMEEMEKILPENITMPSYHQVRRFHNKRSRLDRERGRKTGSAFTALKGYRKRDTSNYKPLGLGICDGHSFKAKVANPMSGRPFKPEICAIIDAATRVIVGWSTGLAESATTVADAVRHAATVNKSKPFGGVFDTLYTDGGSGNTAKINTDEFTGLFPRLGTTHETGRPGNAQARGIIERLNKSLWIRAAKKLPTFMGKEMDKLTERNVYLLMAKDFRKNNQCSKLISWPAFLLFCEQEVDAYNRRPHSSLPKINDPETGRRRHLSPFEAWAWHMGNGWQQEDHQLTDGELEILFRPRIKAKVVRSSVALFGNSYFDKVLAHYRGQEVQVGYDIHDGERVQVWDKEDRLICYAGFEKNRTKFFPQSQQDKAADDRAKRRAKIKQDQLEEIDAERRGVIDITSKGQVIDISAASPEIKVDRAALQLEMTAKAAVVEIPEDDKGKFVFWNALDARLSGGENLNEKELLFYEAYRKSASYRAFKSVADTLGRQQEA